MKIEIKNRWSGAVQFVAEIEATEDTPLRVRLGLAVKWALSTGADLTGADLRGADLRGADLTDADLTDADLRSADLTGADLTPIRDDLFAVLSSAPAEVPALLAALNEGRVDGSTYHGTCACLVGTLANARGCKPDSIPGLSPNSNRPIERFFCAIKPGDTPANNQAAELAAEWVSDWLARMQGAFGVKVGA